MHCQTPQCTTFDHVVTAVDDKSVQQEAVEAYSSMLHDDPRAALVLASRGRSLAHLRTKQSLRYTCSVNDLTLSHFKRRLSLVDLQRSFACDPGNTATLADIGIVLQTIRRDEIAFKVRVVVRTCAAKRAHVVQLLSRALDADPRNWNALCAVAQIQSRHGQHRNAFISANHASVRCSSGKRFRYPN